MKNSPEHRDLAAIHQASNTAQLGKALFNLIAPRMPNELLFIALLPIKFELPSLFSEPKYKSVCDNYVKHTNRYDIWLKRSPIGPHVQVVRHSDYTPFPILRRSLFFKEVMTPINSHYGASMVAWEKDQWLATLTVFKNQAQGDFTEDEMRMLLDWQLHFEIAVRRIARAKESSMDENSLASFMWDLPTATLMLDWDLNLRHYNAAAVENCRMWHSRNSHGRIKLSKQKLLMPREWATVLEALKPMVEKAKPSRPGPLKPIELKTITHPQVKGLLARIYFIPSKSLALSRGRFLIQLHSEATTANAPALSSLASLTRRERETALHAARGLSNVEIGKALDKSPGTVKVQLGHVFKKLKIRSRAQLAALLKN